MLSVSTSGKINLDIDDFEENKENVVLAPILFSFEQLFGNTIEQDPFDEEINPNLQEFDEITKTSEVLSNLKLLIAAIDDNQSQQIMVKLPQLNLMFSSTIKSSGSGKLF